MFVSFTTAREQENGRLRYFGFSNLDCGIVIQGSIECLNIFWTYRRQNHACSVDILQNILNISKVIFILNENKTKINFFSVYI